MCYSNLERKNTAIASPRLPDTHLARLGRDPGGSQYATIRPTNTPIALALGTESDVRSRSKSGNRTQATPISAAFANSTVHLLSLLIISSFTGWKKQEAIDIKKGS